MDVKNCRKCKRLFNYIGGQQICPACREAIEAEFRYLSLWNYHVIPHDVDVYQYHNDYRLARDLPAKDFNE